MILRFCYSGLLIRCFLGFLLRCVTHVCYSAALLRFCNSGLFLRCDNQMFLFRCVTQVCYAGVGESEAGTEDNTPFPEARRAEVIVTSGKRPFEARWQCLKQGRKKP